MHGEDLETTLESPVSTQGVGLHHGVPVSMTLRPAPAGSGIVFRRTDLDGFAIRAAWKHVWPASATPPASCAKVCSSRPRSIC
ncbi:MAG: UDP-3-O-acyl-N-acetylglucosamine deacetylase [Bryobacterales bacterium]